MMKEKFYICNEFVIKILNYGRGNAKKDIRGKH